MLVMQKVSWGRQGPTFVIFKTDYGEEHVEEF